MRAQYPFFRDRDEQTQAVIGEEAVNADLEGDYQKPYAVLTQKRLYCKNEQGNFITDADALKSAGKGLLPGQNWFLWDAAVCVGLALVLLCLLYWAFDGRQNTESISYDAQRYIENYQALEEKIPDYEQTIKDYEDAEKEIEQLQQELEEMDHDAITQEAEQVHREADKLQAALDKATTVRDEQQSLVNQIKNEIADYNKNITEAENKIKNTDTAKNNEIKLQIDALQKDLSIWRKWQNATDEELDIFEQWTYKLVNRTRVYTAHYLFDGQDFGSEDDLRRYCKQEADEVQKELSEVRESYVDIEYLQNSIEWNRRYIAESETYLAECQQQLEVAQKVVDAAQAEVNNYRPTVVEADAKADEVRSLRANIAQKRSALDSVSLANAQSNIQRFEDSKSDYKNVQSVQRKVKLFLPCLLAFAACVVASIILTALKRIKPAVIAALVSVCLGLVCASLSNINLSNIQGLRWDYYYLTLPPPLSTVFWILLVLAALSAVLALWWNRKRKVYRIRHNTGAFFFTPSLYPAEELRLFAEQVRLMREGEADGE